MTPLQWIAQGIALFACLFSCLSYFAKGKTRFLVLQSLTSACYALQYLCLGVIPAVCNNIAAILRYLIFILYERKGKDCPLWIGTLMTVIGVVGCVVTWDGPLTLIPILTSVSFTVGIMAKEPLILKSICVANAGSFFAYNFIVGAYVSAAYSVFETCSSVAALLRMIRERRAKRAEKAPDLS